jgi:hypothetical protein
MSPCVITYLWTSIFLLNNSTLSYICIYFTTDWLSLGSDSLSHARFLYSCFQCSVDSNGPLSIKCTVYHVKPRIHITNEPERASTCKCEHKQTLTSTHAHKWTERRKHTAKISVPWLSSRSLRILKLMTKITLHTYETQTNTNSYFSLKNR